MTLSTSDTSVDYTSLSDEFDLSIGLENDEKLGFRLITLVMIITCITIFIIVLL